MKSRGSIYALGAGTRRGLVLLWTALLLSSMLLQYVVAAAPVLAVHDEGLFELDGNATDGAAPGDDWNSTNNADATVFIPGSSEDAAHDTTYFTGGGSKDVNDISQWKYTANNIAPDKDQILDAYAAAYEKGGDTFVYFGADRFDGSGDAFIGFWFVQDKISLKANGGFNGVHKTGDILVVSDFTNGGSVSEIKVYEWVNGGLSLKNSGATCDVPGDEDACAIVNAAETPAPWPFLNKSGSNAFAAGEFYEGGVNLDTIFGGDAPCYSSFIAETRSSQSTTAQLKDFALGSFNTCKPPTIATQVSASNVDFGGSVTDTATLSGNDGAVTGSVTFFLCGPEASNPDCSTGGTKVGGAVTIAGGSATSAAYTVGVTAAASGKYCWRAEYTPDAASQYLAGEHTNKTTECFTVDPATITITKTANPAGPVNAGEQIGFDITVENDGTQTTLGVNVTDTLPAGIAWTADAPTGSTTGLSCSITSGVLTCTKPSLAAGASFTVHVHGMTDAADCDSVSNTASVATSNDGSDSDGASVGVNCPDIKVTKTPDGASINAGDTATFTIKVENIGDGDATGVQVSDVLPVGPAWTENEADCHIVGSGLLAGTLICDVGNLAAGASRTYTVSAPTTRDDCGDIDNTASASAANEPSNKLANNSDDGLITVLCAEIDIAKTADNGTVNAGDEIGFTITVANNGDGVAYNVSASDTLDAAFSWSLKAPVAGWTLVGNQLGYTAASLAVGASSSVHVVAMSTPEDCRVVNNTASVTAGNDGSDQASASVTIECPDITVVKTAVATPVSAGDPIAFDITVSNSNAAGTGTAYTVNLNDPLPNGITWAENSDACTISGTGDDQVLDCNWASLAKGASATVRISGTTSSAVCGSVPNTATVTAGNEPLPQTNNVSTATVVVNCPDITVEKVGNGPLSAGDVASFSIKVENIGVGTAYGVTLSDPLPNGITWTEDSGDCSITAGVLSCDFGTLLPGAIRMVTVSGETDAEDCGEITNTAIVEATNEPLPQTNNSSTDTIVVDCPAVVITKTADAPSVSATDEIGFVVTVTNTGDGNAYGVIVSDTLPVNGGLGWSIDAAGSDTGWTIVGGVLMYGPATIASGAHVSVHIVSDTTPASCGLVDNTASMTYQGGSGDDSSRVTVLCPDVTISKTADNSPILAGQTASYTISAWNKGDGTAYNVTISDTLPAGIAWTENSEACSITNGVLACVVGDLAGDEIFSVTVSGPTTVEACGLLPNSASVAAANEATSAKGNNTDDASITVQCASISLVKTAGDAADGTELLLAAPGDVVFTYVVTNTGTAALTNVALVDDNATPGDTSDDWAIICPKTELAAGESMTCSATLPVGTGLRINIATVTANPVLDPEAKVGGTDDAVVRVPEPEVTPTPTPSGTVEELTLPPTSTIDGGTAGTDGNGLFLILVFIVGFTLTAGYLVPAPARARRRNNRS